MRPVNIVLLVLAGAIGGAVVMRVVQRPQPQQAAEVETSAPAAPAPSPIATTAAIPAAPAETPPVEPPATLAAPPAPVVKAHGGKDAPGGLFYRPKRVAFRHPAVPMAAPIVVAQVQRPPAAAPSTPAPTPEQPKETPPGNMEPQDATPVPTQIPVTPEPHTVTLNAGMSIPVRLVDSLSLERNHVGDRFAATLDSELVAGDFVIAERGARVEGVVVTADTARKTLSIELTRVTTSDRQDVTIQTERFEKRNEPDRAQDVTNVAAGTVLGAAIGGMAGGGKGAAA
jgi:hypothetical protein